MHNRSLFSGDFNDIADILNLVKKLSPLYIKKGLISKYLD